MAEHKPTFEVDKKGLAKLLERRGKEFALTELWQNAVDEDGVTSVAITLTPASKDALKDYPDDRTRYSLVVTDDAPEGFADMAHAYTLFAESNKKGRADQRGRFNLGEKLVIAICDYVAITTTKGQIEFTDAGREEHDSPRSKSGSEFAAILPMTEAEAAGAEAVIQTLIVPKGVTTTFNGRKLVEREPLKTFEVTLRTELADDEGYLRPTRRKTKVAIYDPLVGEKAALYEMGIPVVETDDRWHVDIGQKVPLTTDRDNVPPGYLRDVRVAVLNACSGLLKPEDATGKWVDDALEDEDVSADSVQAVVKGRFGPKAVIEDRTDPEGTKLAVTEGYTVVPGGAFSKPAWKHVKEHDGLLPAGQVTPSPDPSKGTENLTYMEPEHQPGGVRHFVAYTKEMAKVLLGAEIEVKVVNDITWPFGAAYGPAENGKKGNYLINYGRKGHNWFKTDNREAWDRLNIHELAHHRAPDHLAHEFHDECCALGAAWVSFALEHPEVACGDASLEAVTS